MKAIDALERIGRRLKANLKDGAPFDEYTIKALVDIADEAISHNEEVDNHANALSDALEGYFGVGTKRCGHNFDCICCDDFARSALSNYKAFKDTQ